MIMRTLIFLGFVDPHDGNLNKTGILLYIVAGIYIYKALTAVPQPMETTALLGVILQSLGKKIVNKDQNTKEE